VLFTNCNQHLISKFHYVFSVINKKEALSVALLRDALDVHYNLRKFQE